MRYIIKSNKGPTHHGFKIGEKVILYRDYGSDSRQYKGPTGLVQYVSHGDICEAIISPLNIKIL